VSTLLDTNILTRSAQSGHPQQLPARNAVKQLFDRGEQICIVPQNLYEFWAVATRSPAENGLGMSMVEAESELARVKEVFTLLGDEEGILQEWERLVIAHQVRGKTSHDARLVAAMHRHGLTHLLTFNASHFNRFPGITVVTPEEVLQAGS
jgi:predicted nucleic acid-binding protein